MNIAFSFGGEDKMSDVLPRKRTVPLLASRRSPKLFAVPPLYHPKNGNQENDVQAFQEVGLRI